MVSLSAISSQIAVYNVQRRTWPAILPGKRVPLSPSSSAKTRERFMRRVPFWIPRSQVVQSAGVAAESDTIEVELKVQGMVCGHCSERVQNALQGVDSVKSASVSHETGLATVHVKAESLTDAWNEVPKLQKVVTETGFEAEPHFGDLESQEEK